MLKKMPGLFELGILTVTGPGIRQKGDAASRHGGTWDNVMNLAFIACASTDEKVAFGRDTPRGAAKTEILSFSDRIGVCA